jgi:signal peptidase I
MSDNNETQANLSRKSRIATEIFEFAELVAISLGIILLVFTFFARHSLVVGDSMIKTLENGDRLIISDLFYSPKCGDVIVCQVSDEQQKQYSQLSPKEAIVKRVITTEGQTVKIEDGRVFVDGFEIVESYKFTDGIDRKSDMEEYTVSEGCVFVMGDHRNNSLDSRYFGEIDERLVLGKVVLRVFPFSRFGSIYK